MGRHRDQTGYVLIVGSISWISVHEFLRCAMFCHTRNKIFRKIVRAMAFEDIFQITSVLGVGFSFVTLSAFDLSSQAEERGLKRRWDSEGQLLPLPFCFLRQDQGIISEGLLGF